MRLLSTAFLASALLVFATTAHATDVSGVITTQTWTKEGSPYNIRETVTVPDGHSLVIEPGVKVNIWFGQRLAIEGRLRAVGTESNRITIRGGNVVFRNAGFSTLRWVLVTECTNSGVRVWGTPLAIDHTVVANNEDTRETSTSGASGGGLLISARSTVSITRCEFRDNHAAEASDYYLQGRGGGIYVGDSSSVTIVASTFSGNRTDHGAAIYATGGSRVHTINSTVTKSIGREAIKAETGSRIRMENCTVAENSESSVAVAGDVVLNSSIVWENGSAVSGVTATYCDIGVASDSTVYPGVGNIYADPGFTNSWGGNFSLVAGSSCIDAGDPDLSLDRDSTVRDMGVSAFEEHWNQIGGPRSQFVATGGSSTVELANLGSNEAVIDSVGLTGPFEVVETLPIRIAAHGNAFLRVIYTGLLRGVGSVFVVDGFDPGSEFRVDMVGYFGRIVGGSLSTGTWSAENDDIWVTRDCVVPANATVTVEAGVNVYFEGPRRMTIDGCLKVQGERESIVTFNTSGSECWRGIRVQNGGQAVLRHTRISGAEARGGGGAEFGGAIRIIGNGSEAVLDSCELTDCSAPQTSTTTNWSKPGYILVYLVGSGGAVYAGEGGTATLVGCDIHDNSAIYAGGAAFVNSNGSITFDRCVLRNNSCARAGGSGGEMPLGGLIAAKSGGQVSVLNSTIADNGSRGDGLYVIDNGHMSISNSILWNSGQLVDSSKRGYNLLDEYDMSYSDNAMADEDYYWRYDLDTLQVGPGNISADPRFLDPENGDYRLTATSPCYNTGDPDSPLDPDGTRADMGAFRRDHDPVSAEEVRPLEFSLSQNAPNPFNPGTTIEFSVTMGAHVSLSIFNTNGQLVRTLIDGHVDAGIHTASWDGRDTMGRPVASGVYLYRLTGTEGVVTRKMVLVR